MTELPKGSFLNEGKEPVIDRVFQLVDRYPSKSAAARAWGMKVSTLLNYYKRRDANPTPRRAQLLKIAEVENTSIDWLLHGENNSFDSYPHKKEPTKEPEKERDTDTTAYGEQQSDSLGKLLSLLSFLSEDERLSLIAMLARKGVETALLILDEDMIRIAQARPTVKKAALMLNDLPDARVKEILAEIEGTEHAQLDTLNKKLG